ncbi:MBL fold metallo-hydrolase, partial [Chitinimonas sp.]|uniref:MBL fold metallo-hydrolase n=1 Tax=Chitinimonas sp. TaxID=1934313 RepID=UPI0035AEFD3B
MLRQLLRLVVASLAAHVLAAEPGALPEVGFAVIKTSQVAVRQALLVPGGELGKRLNSNFSAFLIKHRNDYLLFDTGLGKQIDTQYRDSMPLWWRPFFSYEQPVISAREQLDAAGMPPPKRVILSHSHWDHASGVPDFPEAQIAVAEAEQVRLRDPSTGPGGTWAAQVGATAIQWEALNFQPVPYRGYPESLDIYQDGSVVLVPMPGHTPGSVGLFVSTDSAKVYFLIGDVAWTVAALKQGQPKFWVASKLVDGDAKQTQSALEKVQALMQADPALQVV